MLITTTDIAEREVSAIEASVSHMPGAAAAAEWLHAALALAHAAGAELYAASALAAAGDDSQLLAIAARTILTGPVAGHA